MYGSNEHSYLCMGSAQEHEVFKNYPERLKTKVIYPQMEWWRQFLRFKGSLCISRNKRMFQDFPLHLLLVRKKGFFWNYSVKRGSIALTLVFNRLSFKIFSLATYAKDMSIKLHHDWPFSVDQNLKTHSVSGTRMDQKLQKWKRLVFVDRRLTALEP